MTLEADVPVELMRTTWALDAHDVGRSLVDAKDKTELMRKACPFNFMVLAAPVQLTGKTCRADACDAFRPSPTNEKTRVQLSLMMLTGPVQLMGRLVQLISMMLASSVQFMGKTVRPSGHWFGAVESAPRMYELPSRPWGALGQGKLKT